MRIRIAQRAWASSQPAESIEEANCGLQVPWVELDGHRYDEIAGVTLRFDENIHVPVLEFFALGTVEIAYLGKDGQVLGAVEVPAADLAAEGAAFDGATARMKDEPVTAYDALRQRDGAIARLAHAEERVRVLSDALGSDAAEAALRSADPTGRLAYGDGSPKNARGTIVA